MKRICVFCGSSPGRQPEYAEAAKTLAEELVKRNLGLVYGGASVGTMGIIARTALSMGGEVIGVIPQHLAEKEVAFSELSDLRVVGSMHERKALMAELSDGFIALPGGLGTIEEFFEVLTWSQLGIHPKPCGLLNVLGYYDHILAFLKHATEEQFVEEDHRSMVKVSTEPSDLLDAFDDYQPPTADKARWALQLNKT